MKRLKFIFTAILIINATFLFGQSKWTAQEIAKANTAKNVSYLSQDEKEVILYTNLARLNGKKFLEIHTKAFVTYQNNTFSSKIKPKNKYLLSVQKDLSKTANLPMIFPDACLSKASKYHSKDMGKKGKTGHTSSNGKSFSKRIKSFCPKRTTIAENCSYGMDKAVWVVCQLLIDDGISSLGHRKNMLNPIYNICGVGVSDHKIYRTNCVIDYSN